MGPGNRHHHHHHHHHYHYQSIISGIHAYQAFKFTRSICWERQVIQLSNGIYSNHYAYLKRRLEKALEDIDLSSHTRLLFLRKLEKLNQLIISNHNNHNHNHNHNDDEYPASWSVLKLRFIGIATSFTNYDYDDLPTYFKQSGMYHLLPLYPIARGIVFCMLTMSMIDKLMIASRIEHSNADQITYSLQEFMLHSSYEFEMIHT